MPERGTAMDYRQFVNEVQQRGHLSTFGEAEVVVHSVLRAMSEVLPRDKTGELCPYLPSELSPFLEPRCTEPDSLIDGNTFIGWSSSSFDTTGLPDRSLGGTDLMAFYGHDEAARRCHSVFGALKSCWESGQCEALMEFLPGEVKSWFMKA